MGSPSRRGTAMAGYQRPWPHCASGGNGSLSALYGHVVWGMSEVEIIEMQQQLWGQSPRTWTCSYAAIHRCCEAVKAVQLLSMEGHRLSGEQSQSIYL